jgi:ADP-sugar diphosphatase
MLLPPTTLRQTTAAFLRLPSIARNMSTFTHPRANIPVTLPDGLTQDQVLSFHPFQVGTLRPPKLPPSPHTQLQLTNHLSTTQTWLATLQNSLSLQSENPSHPFHKSPYVLRSVTIQSYDLFGKRIGFLKLTSTVSTSTGEWLPGAVFLRGASVAMLVMLIPEDAPADTEERYVLLTVQPRIAAGSLEFVELPAGMVDEEDNFAGTAAKEIKEELGMEIHKDKLKNLSDLAAGIEDGGEEMVLRDGNLPCGVFPSPGACDEFIPIFAHERRVPRAQLGEWTGKLTGLREEGEKITLKLVRLQDVWKEASRDGKTLAALALWEGLRREGKI